MDRRDFLKYLGRGTGAWWLSRLVKKPDSEVVADEVDSMIVTHLHSQQGCFTAFSGDFDYDRIHFPRFGG